MFRILLIIVLFFNVSAVSAYPDYHVFTENGKQGLKNDQGQVLIPPHFDALGWGVTSHQVKNGRIGFLKDGKWGVVAIDNRILYPAELDIIFDANTEVIVTGKKQPSGRFKKGAINYDGKVIIAFEYDNLQLAGERFIASQNQHFGILNYSGKVIIPFDYSGIRQVADTRFYILNNKKNGALFNHEGDQLTEFSIHRLEDFRQNTAIAHIDHFSGLIDVNGNWILEPVFKGIKFNGGVAVGVPYSSFSYFNQNSDIHWEVDSINAWEGGILQHFASGKTWLTDMKGELIFPKATALKKHKNLVAAEINGMWGLYHLTKGDWFIKPDFHSIKIINDHLFIGKRAGDLGNFWTFYSLRTGQEIFKGVQEVHKDVDGIYVKKKDAWGFFDTTGNVVLPPVYDNIKIHKNNQFVVTLHDEDGIIDYNQEWRVLPGKRSIIDFNDRVYLSLYDGLYNMNDYEGERIYFSPNKLRLSDDVVEEYEGDTVINKVTFDGLSIKTANNDGYKEVLPMAEDFIGIYYKGQYGFIDSQGRLRIANRYQGIQPFHNGFAAVKLRDKWGVIDKLERLVVQPHYDSVGFFRADNSIVRVNGRAGIINSSGNVVLDIAYDDIQPYAEKYYRIYQDNKVGIADVHGKVIIWPKFDEINFSGRYFIVRKDESYGLQTTEGVAVVPPVYKQIIPIPGDDDFIIGRQKEKVVVAIN